MQHSVSFTPTTFDLDKIEKWLIEEKESYGEGFYCNWTIIRNFFRRNELAVLFGNDEPIGFCCWRATSNHSGQINLFEIKINFRNNGLGTYFTRKVEEYCILKNIYALDLQCEPENSEFFWRKVGYIDVPPSIHYWDKYSTHLFRRLVPAKQEVSCHNGINFIEMWEEEPRFSKNTMSKWKWNLDAFETRKLTIPIIQPCEKEWRIKLVLDGGIIIDEKIKRFGGVQIEYGPYAIISELPVG